jgi:hypothetical protein
VSTYLLSLDIFIGLEKDQKLTTQHRSVNDHLATAMEEKVALSEH